MTFTLRAIANASSSLSICLQCQFRLRNRIAVGIRQIRPYPRTRLFSNIPQRCVDLTPPVPSEPPTTPPRKRRGLKIEDLNREILVLELPAPKPIKKKAIVVNPDLDADSLSADLLVYEGESGLDIARAELSLLKPQTVKVSAERYDQLFGQLGTGFNKDQIHNYCAFAFKEKKQTPPSKNLSKAELLDIILKELWGVQIAEEIQKKEDVIIRKEYQLSREDIYFLIGQNGKTLRHWAEAGSARITVNVQESRLIFDASQVSIEKLERKLPNVLGKKIVETVDLAGLSRFNSFNSAYISLISQLTQTFIHPPIDNSVKVSALGPSMVPIHDARRLILNSYDLHPQEKFSLLADGSFSPDTESSKTLEGALYRVIDDDSLSWIHRGKEWARWRSVRTKVPALKRKIDYEQYKSARETEEAAKDSEADSPTILKLRKETEKSAETVANVSGLQEIRRRLDEGARTLGPDGDVSHSPEYSAVFGYLLHDSFGEPRKTGTLEKLLEKRPERAFCSNIPGLNFITTSIPMLPRNPLDAQSQELEVQNSSQLTPSSDGSSTEASQLASGTAMGETEAIPKPPPLRHTFTLKFTASPWAHPDTFERYPPVELTLDLNPQTGMIVGEPRLTANYFPAVADMMLPNRDCDVRFFRNVKVPLHKKLAAAIVPEIDPKFTQDQKDLEIAEKEELKDKQAEKELAAANEYESEPPGGLEKNQVISSEKDAGTAQPSLDEELDHSEELAKYLKNSKLNPFVGRVVPATTITLNIPKLLIDNSPSTPTEEAEEGKDETGKEEGIGNDSGGDEPESDSEADLTLAPPTTNTNTPTTYIFTAIEHRSTLSLLSSPYRMQKSIIEGGISGGKRLEVSVHWENAEKEGGFGDVEEEGGRKAEKEEEKWKAEGTFEHFVGHAMGLVDKLENMTRSNL